MPKIIAISNPKGGVGKTTTSINLAASLAIAEQRVLIVDIDPDGAVGTGLGLQSEQIRAGIFEVYSGTANFDEALHHLDYLNLDIIPANVQTSEQEIRLTEMAKNRIWLKRQLSGLISCGRLTYYDYVIIDTPPALNDLAIGALLAADSVLIPLQCGHFALKAVDRLMQMIQRIKKSANPHIAIEGILLTFYEKGTRVSLRSSNKAQALFKNLVLKTVIPKNVALGFSAYEEKPLALVDITAPGAQAYLMLAEEIMQKNKDRQSQHLEPHYESEHERFAV